MSNDSSSPSAAGDDSQRTFSRRILLWLAVAAGFLATLAVAIPFVGFLFGPVRRNRIRWVNLGAISNFPKDQTRLATFDNPLGQSWDGVTAQNAVFVRYLGLDASNKDQFLIFAVNCAHLGCPVTWFPQSGLFMCPCHGGVYYENGEYASGPPPRGLFHCVWRVQQGNLEIQAPHYPTLQNTLKDQG
jgi:Rieske Fe-S protein